MKTLIKLVLALAIPTLWAEPALHLDTSTIRPETTFKLTFDRAVVPPAQIGKSAPNEILAIAPPLAGNIKWIEPNVALFERTGVPRISTRHSFSLVPGLRHADGSVIPAVAMRTVSTGPFVYEYSYWSGHTRTPNYYVRFNDEVNPTALASFFSFADKQGNVVAARVTRGTWRQSVSTRSLGPTWAESFSGWKAPQNNKLPTNTPIATAVTVVPVHPLPVGESWKLVLKAGLPNASRTAAIAKDTHRWVGTVRPFEISSIQAVTIVDEKRHISIGLSKPLPENFKSEALSNVLSVEPVPDNMEIIAKRSLITIKGDFSNRAEWTVTMKSGLVADDGLAMTDSKSEKIKFRHLPPILAMPSYAHAQLSTGSRKYLMETVNVASARIRVKQLAGADAIRALQGYRHYSGDGPGRERFPNRHAIPYSLLAGKTIFDKTIKLDNAVDTSRNLDLNWNEVIGESTPNGLLFITVESEPKSGMESAYNKRKITQAFVQLTDIGLAWKLTDETAFIYAYSCETGEPLPGVVLDIFGEDAEALQTARTNDSGVASLPRDSKQRQLRASLSGDNVIVDFDDRMPTVSMWRFPVRTEWDPSLPNRRTAFLFTDRTLYRPGELVHLKGIVRRIHNNRSIFDTTEGAQLIVRDSASRILIEKEITLSAQGSFDHSFNLPSETVGFFNVQLSWPSEIEAAEEEEDWRKRNAIMNSARFVHSINVQEFRRNAFEVKADFADGDEKNTLKLDLHAKYFQGQPVGSAGVKWFYRSSRTGFYPARYRDYLFCDHRSYDPYYWSHYFGYSEDNYYGSKRTTRNGTATLDADGFASIDFALEEIEFPSPRNVTVTSEVTDLRNQTLSSAASRTVHSSDLYLGVSRVDRLARVGNDFPLKVVVVTQDGLPSEESASTTLKIEREINEQIKTKTASGTVAVRNEKRLEFVEERVLTIDAVQNKAGGLLVPFNPAHPGRHILTFSGTDRAGQAFRTSIVHYVYGAKEYPWAYESGMKIKLVPEKKLYKPGETARILVLSPIEGTALVTFEREGVQRHMVVELNAKDPVVEVPVTHDDAPNTFVSVLVIKGARDNKREHKEPILRLGYCELMVENQLERLQVAMKIPGDYHRPGEEIVIDGLIRDHQGNPVDGAEVTLYAEDEGTLAVAGYDNPEPLKHFYAPRSLRIEAGTSLGRFISENPEERWSFNKGFFIGGGGEEDGGDLLRPREDFNPCAVWSPALVTDANGKFEVRFDSPDTLTRYRVIAVAQKGPANFGSNTSEFVVNKPLMLEPSVPRFAHEGDRLQPKVLVQNATSYTGTWQISLKVGSITKFMEGSDKSQTKTVTIPPDGDATVSFDLAFADTGTVDWQWSAKPLSVDGANLTGELQRELSDAVVTRFDVEYPMPLLRQTRFIRFEDPSAQRDLLEGLSKELLEGRGDLELEFGRSVLLEAAGAMDFLLKYPYGCVEQTTSSTIPWIAALNMREVAPAFRKKTEREIRRNIQAGANRIISMQTDDGGLGYWPGADESTDWASAYGGMTLLLCKEAGADVPASVITGLTKYLSENLRGLAKTKDWWELETACRGAYTLALAGAPEVPYHNKLIERVGDLSPNSLNFLALAVNASGADKAKETAQRLLETKVSVPQNNGHFLHNHPSAAYRLLALSTIQPDATETAEVLDKLLQSRNRAGHWHTTWGNAWTIFALGEYAKHVETQSTPPVIKFVNDEGERELLLDDKNPSEAIKIPLHGGLKALASAPKGAFARVKLASKPKIAPSQSVSKNGLQIMRTYHLVKADGSSELLKQPKVGDLVRIELQVTLPRDGTRYLVIDDPLPSLFETINTTFASQAGRVAQKSNWRVSHQELRDDRAVFFINYAPRSGVYSTSYYARVTTAGEATAPPAKIEAMYEPEFFALSPSRVFKTPNPLNTAMR